MKNNEKVYVKRKMAHKELVGKYLSDINSELINRAVCHDDDKILVAYPSKEHKINARHHWLSTNASKVNLLDLLEMIADVKAASDAKHPSFIYVVIQDDIADNEMLKTLITNTVNYLYGRVRIKFISTSDFEKLD